MKINSKVLLFYLIFLVLAAGTIFVFYYLEILKFDFSKYPLLLIFACLIIFIFPLILSFIISTGISKKLKLLSLIFHKFFTDKNIPEKISSFSGRTDEFGVVFSELINLQATYNTYKKFTEELISGNFDAELKNADKESFGAALIELKENLLTYEKEKKYNLKELERNNWYQSGVTAFTLLLQQDFKSTEEMAYPVIRNLAEHLGIDQIGIFILQKKEEKELLILEAAYAYDKKKLLDTEIEIGESLVGKCAKEQKLIRIDDLPEGYTYISSGLGEDTPKSLILSPLMYEKKLFGVLEIASLKKLPDYKINFLNIIAERIAAEISNINSKKLRAKLAEDYKKQSEELSLEEKKAEDKITELIKEKELITNKYKIISEDIELINMTVPSIIFDSKGIIKKINKAAEKLYNIKKEDILNKNGKDIFTENHKFSDLFNKVLKGEIQYNRFFNEKRTEETAEQYIPVKEKNAEIQKVILTAMKIKRT